MGLADQVSDWFIQAEQRQGSVPQRRDSGQRYGVSHEGLARVLSAMETHVGEALDRTSLALIGGVSIRQIERLFASQLGTTLSTHYQGIRLNHARRLLTETTMTVAETGAASGFSNASHFSRIFKRHFSVSPSGFRRRTR